jgi:hypothetical protein
MVRDASRSGRRPSRRAWGAAALAALLLLLDQALQHGPLADGYLGRRRVAPFDPPLFNPVQQQRLAELERRPGAEAALQFELPFDAELGWCPRPGTSGGESVYDWAGARVGRAPLPRERSAGVRRAVAVGCSFTRGDEVSGGEAWPAALDELLPGLEVANLGVGGYGSDQALLRFRRDGAPLAPDEVWLGLVPAVSPRNVTVYWPAFAHWTHSVATKPRFALEPSGELVLVPNPARDLPQVCALVREQRAFLAALGARDAWVRRAPLAYAPRGSHWTHASGLARLWLTWREGAGREARAHLGDPGSELYRVLRALVLQLRSEAAAAGALLRVLVLPDHGDLAARARRGAGYWEPLGRDLAGSGVLVHDLSDALVSAGALADEHAWMPGGHYSAALHGAVARALLDVLAAPGPAQPARGTSR